MDFQKKKFKIVGKTLGDTNIIISENEMKIGEGSFGIVKKAYNMDKPEQQLAVKIIERDNSKKMEAIQNELEILKTIDYHPNLVNFIKINIESKRNFYLLMEFCNQKTIKDYFRSIGPKISDIEIYDFIIQFSQGYRELYKKGILHSDLKQENILVHNGVFKIADFGLSKIMRENKIKQKYVGGTIQTMAPEVLFQRQEFITNKADMFSFGVIIYELMYWGRLNPYFQGNDESTFIQQVQTTPEIIVPKQPKRDEYLLNLIKRMLEKDVEKRISWEEFYELDLIKNKYDSQVFNGFREEGQKMKERWEQKEKRLRGEEEQNEFTFKINQNSIIRQIPLNQEMKDYQYKDRQNNVLNYEFDYELYERKQKEDQTIQQIIEYVQTIIEEALFYEKTANLTINYIAKLQNINFNKQIELFAKEILCQSFKLVPSIQELNTLIQKKFTKEQLTIYNNNTICVQLQNMVHKIQETIFKQIQAQEEQTQDDNQNNQKLNFNNNKNQLTEKQITEQKNKQLKETILEYLKEYSNIRACLENELSKEEIQKFNLSFFYTIQIYNDLKNKETSKNNENQDEEADNYKYIRLHDKVRKYDNKKIQKIIENFIQQHFQNLVVEIELDE